MHKEYKRYLLKKDVRTLLEDLSGKKVKERIFFTQIKLCKAIKYENSAKRYTRIKVTGTQQTQSIVFKKIDKKKFQKKRAKQVGSFLHLNKYFVTLESCTVYIEAYRKNLKGLFLLTVPMKCNDDELRSILNDSVLAPYIEQEVTEDPRYDQKYLALFGNPTKHPYNIYSIFKDLEHKRLQKPQNVIFKEMKSSDAIRIFLYYQYLLLQRYAKEIRNNTNEVRSVYIQAFREEIKRTIAIIKSYEEIFDEQHYQKTIMHLVTLQNVTKTYYDLMLIYRKFTQLNRILQSSYITHMLENLKIKLAHEEHKISNYFSSREYAIISNQYQLFIKEKNRSYNNYESQLPFGYSARVKVYSRHSELLQAINFLDGCNDQKSYEKLKNGFEELLDFIYIFESQINSSSCKPLLKEVAKLYSLLQKYERRNKYLLIMKMLLSHLDKKRHEKEIGYIHNIERRLKHKQKNFDKIIYKNLNHFKERSL